MPNIKSAKKRVKVTATKTLINKMFKSSMKTDTYTVEMSKKVDGRRIRCKRKGNAPRDLPPHI